MADLLSKDRLSGGLLDADVVWLDVNRLDLSVLSNDGASNRALVTEDWSKLELGAQLLREVALGISKEADLCRGQYSSSIRALPYLRRSCHWHPVIPSKLPFYRSYQQRNITKAWILY